MDRKVSIIIPIYNSEKTLDRCLNSVLLQTHSNIEIILVDDGSTDQSLNICRTWAEKDDRITLIHKENRGVSSARNAGLAAATGQYIMFCDSDDCVKADWCKSLLETIELHPDAFVVCNIILNQPGKLFQLNQEGLKEPISYFDLFQAGLSPFPVNKIFDKSVLDKYGLRFDENMQLGEDVKFTLAYYKYCSCIEYIHTPLYEYIATEDSATNSYYPDLFSRNLPSFFLRWEYIDQNERKRYCDIWIYRFMLYLDNTLDRRNTWPFWQKYIYNQKMIRTSEFRLCAQYATGMTIGQKELRLLRNGNYLRYYIFRKTAALKNKLQSPGKQGYN